MPYFQSFSNFYDNSHEKADDSSTVFDADTVTPDEVPSLPAMPPLPMLTATATDYLHNNNETISSISHSKKEESPANTISELLRRINSRHPAMLSTNTTTATATRSEEISRSNQHQSSSSSSSKKRTIITNSSSSHHPSRKKTRQSSRLKKRQPQKPDQSCVDKSYSEVDDENGLEDYEPDEEISTNQSSSFSSSQTSTTTKLTKFDLRWKSKFEELRAFKQLHGHTNVPQRNKQLGLWVRTQRAEYKKFKENGKSRITLERIKMLDSIGFVWELQSEEWNKRFTELKAYKEKYGHTNVPQSNKQLGSWVHHQRQEYKKFKKNGKGKITHERIQTLESISFEWVAANTGCFQRNESKWNERFNELKAYKEEYSDTNVPQNFKNNKPLGTWVHTQRSQYKKFKKNGKSSMTHERIEMLESIDFEWVGPETRFEKDESA